MEGVLSGSTPDLSQILAFTEFFLANQPTSAHQISFRRRYAINALRKEILGAETKILGGGKSVNAKNGHFGPKRAFFDLLAFFMTWDLTPAKIGRR